MCIRDRVKVKELDSKEDSDEEYDADYIVDEKAKTATLTPSGVKKAEQYFNVENLMDSENLTLLHHINPVSYTHLDVYKRQVSLRISRAVVFRWASGFAGFSNCCEIGRAHV